MTTYPIQLKTTFSTVCNTIRGMFAGRSVEKISIDDNKRWEAVIDKRILGHEMKVNRHVKERDIAQVAGIIVALCTGVILGTFLGGILFPFLFIAVPVAGYFLIKGFYRSSDKALKNEEKVKELQELKQTILKSEVTFKQFADQNRGLLPKMTEEQFVKALYLFKKSLG